jgi:hypothetical protein
MIRLNKVREVEMQKLEIEVASGPSNTTTLMMMMMMLVMVMMMERMRDPLSERVFEAGSLLREGRNRRALVGASRIGEGGDFAVVREPEHEILEEIELQLERPTYILIVVEDGDAIAAVVAAAALEEQRSLGENLMGVIEEEETADPQRQPLVGEEESHEILAIDREEHGEERRCGMQQRSNCGSDRIVLR